MRIRIKNIRKRHAWYKSDWYLKAEMGWDMFLQGKDEMDMENMRRHGSDMITKHRLVEEFGEIIKAALKDQDGEITFDDGGFFKNRRW